MGVLRHLVPTGLVFRRFDDVLDAVEVAGDEVKTAFDAVWTTLIPETTTTLEEWEDQFALAPAGLSDIQRAERIDAAWKNEGNLTLISIQSALQAAGFNVFLHEPGSPSPIDPRSVLDDGYNPTDYLVDCGDTDNECGETHMQCGNFTPAPGGYPISNGLITTVREALGCGDPEMECDEAVAQSGQFTGFLEVPVPALIVDIESSWPYWVYIGAEVFPNIATVSANRRTEFEHLALKLKPAQAWLGMLVEYV